jgi:STE24 endopeptidase
VRSFERLGEVWLENPYPNPFVVFWTYSHPSTMQRAEFAAHYDPWQPGAKPRYFLK